MNTLPPIEYRIPTGETLRALLAKPVITDTTVRNLLRRRGVFIEAEKTKERAIPLLCASLITPDECEALLESQTTKEERVKLSSSHSLWVSEHTPLADAMPELNDIKRVMSNPYASQRLHGPITISTQSLNHLDIRFDVERTENHKSIWDLKTVFPAHVNLKLDAGKVVFKNHYTSEESRRAGVELIQLLRRGFKEKSCLAYQDVQRTIRFDGFTPQERVGFFMRLSRDIDSSLLTFSRIRQCDIRSLDDHWPSNLTVMNHAVQQASLSGESLQQLPFLNDEAHWPTLALHELEVDYHVTVDGYEGTLGVKMGFADTRGQAGEFFLSVQSASLDKKAPLTRKQLEAQALTELGAIKAQHASWTDTPIP